jgi:hypothetical protein
MLLIPSIGPFPLTLPRAAPHTGAAAAEPTLPATKIQPSTAADATAAAGVTVATSSASLARTILLAHLASGWKYVKTTQQQQQQQQWSA